MFVLLTYEIAWIQGVGLRYWLKNMLFVEGWTCCPNIRGCKVYKKFTL